MLRLSRPTVGLLATAALFSGLSAWESCADGERTAPLTAVADWVEERVSGERPDWGPQRIATRASTEQLEELTAAVAEDRLSLFEGAVRLREVCCALPNFSRVRFRQVTPGATDEERWCRMLIGRVALRLRTDPERARVVVARLEAELEERLR